MKNFKIESFSLIRAIYLKLLSFVYLSAFLSVFYQVPALFGKDGLLPVYAYLRRIQETHGRAQRFEIVPSLLWYSPGMNSIVTKVFSVLQRFDEYENMMHIFCIVGALLASAIFMEKSTRYFNNFFSFFIMWILYLSIVVTGQIFLNHEWDYMLLEAGFLGMFFTSTFRHTDEYEDNLAVCVRQLLKWLVFRIYFSNGILRLLNGGETWWNLSAYTPYLQSLPLPHVFSWQVFHYSDGMKRFLLASHLSILIFSPFFIFFPFRMFRLTAGIFQIIYQIFLIWTGNYGFSNYLGIAICLSVLDDKFVWNFVSLGMARYFGAPIPEEYLKAEQEKRRQEKRERKMMKEDENEKEKEKEKEKDKDKNSGTNYYEILFKISMTFIIIFSIFYFYFPIETWTQGKTLPFDQHHLRSLSKVGFVFGALGFIFETCYSLYVYSIKNERFTKKTKPIAKKIKMIMALLFCFVMFASSLHSFSRSLEINLDRVIHTNLLKIPHDLLNRYKIINQYGETKKMVGIPKRSELIIEGSEDGQKWKEYDFQYKPGDQLGTPRWAFTYHPKVDYQFALAAYGNDINEVPWLIILLEKFFRNSPNVMTTVKTNPFRLTRPPNYLRIDKHFYYYSDEEEHNRVKNYWRRDEEEKKPYLNTIKKTDPMLKKILQEYGIEEIDSKKYGLNVMQWIPIFEALFTIFMLYFLKNFMMWDL